MENVSKSRTTTCKVCHRQFPYRWDSSNTYCSRLCFYRSVSGMDYTPERPKCSWCRRKVNRCPAHTKGHQQIFCSSSCMGKWNSKNRIGSKSSNYKGGEIFNGYRIISIKKRRVFEHRAIMERKLGRPLVAHEVVHHMNHNRLDNRPENLSVLSNAAHASLHAQRWTVAGRKIRQSQLRRLAKHGWSTRKIAKRLGVCQSSVARRMNKLKIPFNFPTTHKPHN